MSNLLYEAARSNRLETILHLLDTGVTGNEKIALGAIKGGHKNILNWVIKRFKKSYSNWDYLAICAAKEGHRSMVGKLVEMGAYQWQWIAYTAYNNKHFIIVHDMVELGVYCSDLELFVKEWKQSQV